MIVDARTLEDGSEIAGDICIVGGGPAGITLALELAQSSGLKILLLESGGEYLEDDTQALYEGPNLGRAYEALDEARLRFLGGTSNHWTGHCMRLTEVDFEGRDWIANSRWPVRLSDIEPYYDRAAPYVQIQADRSFDFSYWAGRAQGEEINWDSDLFANTLSCISPPTLFGFEYFERLRDAENITVVLHANVLNIKTNDTASQVTELEVATLDGPRLRAKARDYVLAAGGIETARLLLLSNTVAPAGLGNDHDQVGRYFADHIAIRPCMQIWPNMTEGHLNLYDGEKSLDDGYFWATVTASDRLLRNEPIGGFMFHFQDAWIAPGARASRVLRGAARSGNWPPPYLSSHVINLFTDLDDASLAILRKLVGNDNLFERKWLGPWLSIECVPNPDSRVRLVEDKDHFGQRRVGLDWRLTDHEMRTFKRATELLIQEVGRLGLGRCWTTVLREDFELPDRIPIGKHAIGTARMSDSPHTGVVDKNCKVHGMANLFVAGSAVFTTGGYVQPTFSIVAFAIRLSEHLKTLHQT